MKRYWVFWCVFAMGLLAILLLAGAAVWWWFPTKQHVGRLQPLTEEENLADAQRKQHIVTAIYQYKEDVGLWPHRLDDLVPDYLSQIPEYCHFQWTQYGDWSLTFFGGFPHTALRFSYWEGSGKWNVTTGDWDRPLATTLKEPVPVPADPKAREAKALVELRRRLGRKLGTYEHHQTLVVHLTRQGKYREAREACAECGRAFPKEWWPTLARAMIDAKDGHWTEGEKRLRVWAEEKGEFGYYFLLAHFYERTGHKDRAREARRTASRHPVRDFPDHEREIDWLAWEATDREFHEGQYKTTLALCDRWEEYCREDWLSDPSYLSYRTATFLALGEFGKAAREMEKVKKAGLNIKWADNTGPLGEAITRRNRTFRFEPGGKPKPFTWEIAYE